MEAVIGGRRFGWGERAYVMGIVNMTPDSFSGDGLAGRDEAAIRQGLAMAQAGAEIIDVGGESTRPGHEPVSAAIEIERVERVVAALSSRAGVPISVDTSKLEVAEAAVAAGASVINDVWGLERVPALADLAARHGLALVLMHNQQGTVYDGDLLASISERLSASAAAAEGAGVPPERVILDPGIGFGKTAEQNLEVLRRFHELRALRRPLLVGASRKSFLGKLFGQDQEQRLAGTLAAHVAAILRGADVVRAHDVADAVRAARVAEALR